MVGSNCLTGRRLIVYSDLLISHWILIFRQKKAPKDHQWPQILDSGGRFSPCPRGCVRHFSFGLDWVKSSPVTWGRLCTPFACLAVCMKYANEISQEVLWEHFSWHFSKYTWLPEVLTLWFFPFWGDSFSPAGLLRVCERWGLSESNAFFLFSGYIFLVHKSVAPANGRLAEVAPGWLAASALVPLAHWPFSYLRSCLGCVAATERQAEVNSMWLTCSVFPPQHVTCNQCSDFDKVPQGDLVVSGQSERNWCCTKMYVNTYIIYMGISQCYCCLSTNWGPGIGLGVFASLLYHVSPHPLLAHE